MVLGDVGPSQASNNTTKSVALKEKMMATSPSVSAFREKF
jgi:hypothetical protein